MKTKIRMIKDTTMTNRLKIVLAIGFIMLFQQFVTAQEHQKQQFLQ
ncbi:hypothetical protein [Planktosalinus lacus]|nr:hypothetical protein [Planktosalinus lacus]